MLADAHLLCTATTWTCGCSLPETLCCCCLLDSEFANTHISVREYMRMSVYRHILLRHTSYKCMRACRHRHTRVCVPIGTGIQAYACRYRHIRAGWARKYKRMSGYVHIILGTCLHTASCTSAKRLLPLFSEFMLYYMLYY